MPHPVTRWSRARASANRLMALAFMASLALLAASPTAAEAASPSPAAGVPRQTACSAVNVRTGASTSATRLTSLGAGVKVTVVARVTGVRWRASCAGKDVSGTAWYRISAIGGTSVASRYGVRYVYAAGGLFEAVSRDAAPAVSPSEPLAAQLTRLIKADRAALGLPALKVDARLAAIAAGARFSCPTKAALRPRGRALDLAERHYFSHSIKGCTRRDGSTYTARDIMSVVFGYTGRRSEIIHWNGYGTAPTTYRFGCAQGGDRCRGGRVTVARAVAIAQRNFMDSAVHRAVQLGTYDRFGCGSARIPGTPRIYFSCLYAKGGSTMAPAPTPSPAAGVPRQTACSAVNVRTGASTSATRLTSLGAGVKVTVVARVTGVRWRASCAGKDVSGTAWYRISAIGGTSVASRYGVRYVYAAGGLFEAVP